MSVDLWTGGECCHPPSPMLRWTGCESVASIQCQFSIPMRVSDVGSINWSYEEGVGADSCKFYLVSKICIDNSTKVCYNTRHEKTRFS